MALFTIDCYSRKPFLLHANLVISSLPTWYLFLVAVWMQPGSADTDIAAGLVPWPEQMAGGTIAVAQHTHLCPFCCLPHPGLHHGIQQVFVPCTFPGCASLAMRGTGVSEGHRLLSVREQTVCEHKIWFCRTRGVCYCLTHHADRWNGLDFCASCLDMSNGCAVAPMQ